MIPTFQTRTQMRASNRFSVATVIGVSLAISTGQLGAAEIAAERLFPPAISVGSESVVNVEGKFPNWPVKVWCDRDDVSVVADEESGRLKVTVDGEPVSGIAWLRLYDDESASPLLPLLVDPVDVTSEVEPNNDPASATVAGLPASLVGKLDKANDVDCFAVDVNAGQTLVASVMANRTLRSPMDAVLQLVDQDGNVLAQSDDSRGLDPQIVYPCPADARYVLRLFAFPETPNSTIGYSGAASFVYRIHVTTEAWVDYSLPLLSDSAVIPPVTLFGNRLDEIADPTIVSATSISPPLVTAPEALGWHALRPVELSGVKWFDASGETTEINSLPAVVSGHFDNAAELHRMHVAVRPSAKYRCRVASRSSDLLVDSVITVIDPATGKQLARNDDASRSDRDAMADFTFAAAGDPPPSEAVVEIQLTDLVGGHGRGHAFSVAIAEVQPTVRLTIAADRFRLTPAAAVEIPVNIERRDGFNEELSITVTGLPEGIRCEPVTSETKGDTAKEVKLKLEVVDATAEAPLLHQGEIRIEATPSTSATESDVETRPQWVAEYDLTGGFSTRQIWLSVAP